MISNDFRLALGFSAGLHAAVLVGAPVTSPVEFDVERAPTSVELYLADAEQPQPAPMPEADRAAPVEPEPLPLPVMASEERGAQTEVLPGYLRNPPPAYPRLARERGEEGTVLLEVQVLPSGRCGEVNVLASSGSVLLDQAALRAVRAWVFRPARRWGQAMMFWVEIPMTFRLLDGVVEPSG